MKASDARGRVWDRSGSGHVGGRGGNRVRWRLRRRGVGRLSWLWGAGWCGAGLWARGSWRLESHGWGLPGGRLGYARDQAARASVDSTVALEGPLGAVTRAADTAVAARGGLCGSLGAVTRSAERYVRAAGRHAPVSAYDRAVAATMRERAWRPALVDRVLEGVPAGGRVVEVGAGTGSLAIALSRARPDVAVSGVDGDPQALGIARSKPGSDGVEWLEGDARDLAVADGATDALVMSLLLHHLSPDVQRDALREARRVLAPGGSLHVADFGRPQDPLMAAAFALLRLADGRRNTAPHAAGELSATVTAAGFGEPQLWKSLRTGFGTLELMSAPMPGGVCG